MKPTRNRHYCIGCQRPKMLFETQEKADNFMRFNNSDMASKLQKTPARSYYCSFCCGWHITSVSNEGFAESRDKKDDLLWESIKVAAKATDLKINKSEISTSTQQEKTHKLKNVKPEPSEKENQRDRILNLIFQNMQKAHILLNQTDYDATRALIADSESLYQNAVELIEKHNLSDSRLQVARTHIDKQTLCLNSLISLQNDTKRQEKLIKELEGQYMARAYRRMVITLKNKERILNLVESIMSAIGTGYQEEAQKLLSEMAYVARNGFGGGGAFANRKWAKEQLAIAKK